MSGSATDGSVELEDWNRLGREFARQRNALVAQYHRREVEYVEDLPKDPREEALASAILDEVRRSNAEGKASELRSRFDPAHAPFLPWLIEKKQGVDLPFAVCLGRDEFLVTLHSPSRGRLFLHVAGGAVTPRPEYFAAAASPNTRRLALAHREMGVFILEGWGGAEIARIPWPSAEVRLPRAIPEPIRALVGEPSGPILFESLAVSDDGARVALISSEEGLFIADATEEIPAFKRIYPDIDALIAEEILVGEDDGALHMSMAHCALSPNGDWLAFGHQDSDHLLWKWDRAGATMPYRSMVPASEYPHHANFSNDGTHVLGNSCHLHNGATTASRIDELPEESRPDLIGWGSRRTPYPSQQTIDQDLRGYASCWLNAGEGPTNKDGFAISGLNETWLKSIDGETVWEFCHGSSASSIDFDPVSKTLLITSFSGFAHLIDPYDFAEEGTLCGFNTPKEIKRWIFWPNEQRPLQW